MPHPTVAYKILTADQWAQFQADGEFIGSPIDIADGYIHMSTADQVVDTIFKHFFGQDNLTIVAVELSQLGPPLIWEQSRGGAFFPHLYAPLPMAAVIDVQTT